MYEVVALLFGVTITVAFIFFIVFHAIPLNPSQGTCSMPRCVNRDKRRFFCSVCNKYYCSWHISMYNSWLKIVGEGNQHICKLCQENLKDWKYGD